MRRSLLTGLIIGTSIVCVLWLTESLSQQKSITKACPTVSFRFTVFEKNNPNGQPVRACVGTWVATESFVTAAHCIIHKTDVLRMYDRDDDGEVSKERDFPVVQKTFHTTHDIALVQLSLEGAELHHPVAVVSSEIPSYGTLYTTSLSLEEKDTHVVEATIEQLDNPHVIRVSMTSECLKKGDSGLPFSLSSSVSNSVVAILISGSPKCEGMQTLLRLGPLVNWMSQKLHL